MNAACTCTCDVLHVYLNSIYKQSKLMMIEITKGRHSSRCWRKKQPSEIERLATEKWHFLLIWCHLVKNLKLKKLFLGWSIIIQICLICFLIQKWKLTVLNRLVGADLSKCRFLEKLFDVGTRLVKRRKNIIITCRANSLKWNWWKLSYAFNQNHFYFITFSCVKIKILFSCCYLKVLFISHYNLNVDKCSTKLFGLTSSIPLNLRWKFYWLIFSSIRVRGLSSSDPWKRPQR